MAEPSVLWMPSQSTKAKRKRGERKRGSTVPPLRQYAFRAVRIAFEVGERCSRACVPPASNAMRTARNAYWRAAESAWRDPEIAISVALHATSPGGALCRPRLVRAGVSVTVGDKRGVSDPV